MNIIGTQYIPPSKRAGGRSAGDPPAPPTADTQPVPRPASASSSAPPPLAAPAAPAGLPPGLPLAPTSSSTVARPLHLLPTRLEAPAHRRTGTAAPPGGSRRGGSTAGAKRKTRGGRTASAASTPAPAAPPPPPAIIDDSGSDDDDEDKVPVEEHLILRMPANAPETAALRQRVRARDPLDDVKLTFHDDRAGVFTVSGKSMRAKLVDLPCIIEAQKSFDNKQFYKIADVAQMLIVDAVEPTVPENTKAKAVRTAWPDGITPPLRRVRQRRFRQRTVNTSAEQIEAAVENLLRADFMAEQTYCYHVDIDHLGRRTNIVPEDERAPPYPVAATSAAAAAPTPPPPVDARAASVPPPRPSSTVSSAAGTRAGLAPTPPVPHDRMALAGVRGRPGLDLDMDVDDDASLDSAPTAAAAAAVAAKPPAVTDDWAADLADLAGLLEKEVDSMDDMMDDDMDDDMSSMAAGSIATGVPAPRAAKKRPRDEAENGPASSDVDVDDDDMGSLGPSLLDTSLTGLLSTRGMDDEDEEEDDEDEDDEDEDDDVDVDSEMPSRAPPPSSSRPTSTDLRRRNGAGATPTGAAGHSSDVSDSDLDSSDDDDDEDLDEPDRATAAASPRGHDEDDDDDDEELAEKVRLLNEEVATLDQRIHDLQAKLAATANAVLKKRFEEALRQMQSQFEFKQQEIAGLELQRAARTPAGGGGGKVGASRPPTRSPAPPVAAVQEVDEEDEDDLRSESIM
ncbi:hypothetical protein GGF32_010092 [Allomyces javanicus]|nr:hypothetical protein GGF32_010092 [Allomyces javanicus]